MWRDIALFFRVFLLHSGLMRLSSTKLPVTSQWLAMIYNKKRVGKIPVKRKWNYSLISRVYHYPYLFAAKFSTNDKRRRQKAKINGFRLAKQHLCTSNTLCFLHFLYCRSTTSTSNSLISPFTPRTWTKDTDSELGYSPFGINLQRNSPKLVFQSQYPPSLSINHVPITKDLEKLPPR